VFIYGARNAPIGISINTQLVRPGEIKTFWDIMNPKWKGKVVAYQPRTSQAGVTYSQVYWEKDLGPEYLRRIYSWDGIRFVTTTREFSDGLASGAYAIGFLEGPAQREIRALEMQGLPVKMLMGQDVGVKTPRASPGGASTFAAVNRAANPSAQKLFVNWLLSRKGQLLFNRHGEGEYESLRADVPNDDVLPLYRIPKNFYLAEADPESQAKEEAAIKFVRQLINELGL
jgi:ABC-type Fe3+ transport system substrate-binding protein